MPKHDPIRSGYTLPDQDEAAAKRAERAKQLRKEIQDATEAQHYNKAFAITRTQKDAVKAIDHMTNLKEQEAEQLEEIDREKD